VADALASTLKPGRGAFVVEHAGVHGPGTTEPCDRSALQSPGHDGSQSRRLTADTVRRADLILTTQARWRGAVRLLDVHSAPRTFTVLEARHLARVAVERPCPPDTEDAFAWVLEEMDALRGAVPLPPPPWWRRTNRTGRTHRWDLADPHGRMVRHKHTLVVAQSLASGFAEELLSIKVPALSL
jgi:hypothetical protein